MVQLGRIKKVKLREIWKHEAIDFTNWLAEESSLELLSEAIGIGIINSQTEVGVGKFAVDILAEDDNGKKIIIENQLETTNHDHLGKIITYASGLGAEIIIWVVARARQEHEQAVNWLNENTNEGANFFLIEVQAWKIENSRPAPRFNIVAKPNDWTKTVRSSQTANKVTDTKLKQQEFWSKLKDYGEEHSKIIKSWQTPRPQHWFDVSIGSSKANLSLLANSVKKHVSVNLYIRNDKALFKELEQKKDQIEDRLGVKLEWEELPDKKASIIGLAKDGDFNGRKYLSRSLSYGSSPKLKTLPKSSKNTCNPFYNRSATGRVV